uniref:Uncharacterized protein n=1 Tax=Setaria digitata TaxID=48799 RepID=A0A915PP77_9BILA
MKKQQFYYLLLISISTQQTLASFCGSTGVPFSFEVLPSGAPVLGCAQPTCVANLQGEKDDSHFLINANGQADGFMREDDKENRLYGDPYGSKLLANCSGKFADLSCSRKDQWVGGIEYIDHPRQPLILQCCTFAGLRFSQEVGLTNVGPGEAITGGEVIRDGRQISFDVIANVRKVVDANTHIVSYEVTVRRMHCLPDPPEPVVNFDKDVSDEIVKVLTKATDLSAFRREKELKKEKLEDFQNRKAFADTTFQKINERKQYKKMEENEAIRADLWNGNEAIQKQQEEANQVEQMLKSDADQQIAFLTNSRKSEIRTGATDGRFSTGNNGPTVINGLPLLSEKKAFGEERISNFDKPKQHLGSESSFGSVQQQELSDDNQPKQIGNHGSCGTQCNRSPCFMQRCNQGLNPLFGIPTFPPPFFPLNFPTLPMPNFPTVAPQTFQPFISQTYPTVAPPPTQPPLPPDSSYHSSSNSDYAVSFNAPTYLATNMIKIPENTNPNRLVQLSIAPIPSLSTTATSSLVPEQPLAMLSNRPILFADSLVSSGTVTLSPLSTFEEFMAKLGYHNISIATLTPAPLVIPSQFTTATSFPPLSSLLNVATTTAPSIPVKHPQLLISKINPPQSSFSSSQHDHLRASRMFYPPQQQSQPASKNTMQQHFWRF